MSSKKKDPPEPMEEKELPAQESEKAPEPTKEEVLLAEIRDLLKEQSK